MLNFISTKKVVWNPTPFDINISFGDSTMTLKKNKSFETTSDDVCNCLMSDYAHRGLVILSEKDKLKGETAEEYMTKKELEGLKAILAFIETCIERESYYVQGMALKHKTTPENIKNNKSMFEKQKEELSKIINEIQVQEVVVVEEEKIERQNWRTEFQPQESPEEIKPYRKPAVNKDKIKESIKTLTE